MIQANELRVGNILEYRIDDDGIEWDMAILDWQDLKWVSLMSESFNEAHRPIPLTEDWLMKFGFVNKNSWFYKSHFMLGYITTDGHLQTEIKFAGAESKWKVLEIKYVHTLQNLYFALCGEELKIESK